jgi:ribosome-binding ATPase YchF (GTP1/OBG family)
MRIGLIGLPNSGKTTIFNALTKLEAPVTAYTNANAEPNLAAVEVADDRISHLSEMYRPKKTIYTTIEFIDFVGVTKGSAKEGLFSGPGMELIKSADALAIVVRNFPNEPEPLPTPIDDMKKIIDELLISDLIIAENRLERIAHAYMRGKKTNALQIEEKVLRRIVDHVSENRAISELELDREQEKVVRGFQFFTKKPIMVVLNSDEYGFGRNSDLLNKIELSGLNDPGEENLFMADMGIQESARDRLTRMAHRLVGYISFFTVGSDEVRAWNIHKGNTALEAAGAIHSDLARGFIRAECFTYDDLVAYGSEKAVREKGRFRLEGKNYLVQDGNILSIRFNV